MPTLYRQYRPRRFAELFGQEHISATLRQAIEKNRLAHAYLFHGPRGTGKTTTARILAQRVNCEQAKDAEPCGKCRVCIATQNGQNIDLVEIDAASNRGIDDIRALKDGIGLSPAMSKYKVYIIDEVHMLTNEAFTALLKTLEEPSAHAIFILATTELHKVPDTILSRCQVYRFRRATPEELEGRLTWLLKQEKRQADDAALQFIINRSDGCFRDAESLLGQMLTLHDGNIAINDLTEFLGLPPSSLIDDWLAALVAGESAPALRALESAFSSGFDPEQLLKESIIRARDGAVALGQGAKPSAAFAQHPQAAIRLPIIVRALLQALQDLAYVPQPLIALQLAVITVCNEPMKRSSGSSEQLKHEASSGALKSHLSHRPVVLSPAAPKKESMPAGQSLSAKAGPSATGTAPKIAAASPTASVNVTTPEQVTTVWSQLITTVKSSNPVAATFLRAISPQEVRGNVVRLRASYALHRNFFDKPENKKPLEEALTKLLATPVTIQCFLDQPVTGSTITWSQGKTQAQNDLLAAVKEVFGSGKSN